MGGATKRRRSAFGIVDSDRGTFGVDFMSLRVSLANDETAVRQRTVALRQRIEVRAKRIASGNAEAAAGKKITGKPAVRTTAGANASDRSMEVRSENSQGVARSNAKNVPLENGLSLDATTDVTVADTNVAVDANVVIGAAESGEADAATEAATLFASYATEAEASEVVTLERQAEVIEQTITNFYNAEQNVLSLFGIGPDYRDPPARTETVVTGEPFTGGTAASGTAAGGASSNDVSAIGDDAGGEGAKAEPVAELAAPDPLLGDNTYAPVAGFDGETYQGGEQGETAGDLLDASGLNTGVAVNVTGSEAGTIAAGGETGSFSEIERLVLSAYGDVVSAGAVSVGMEIEVGAGDDTVSIGGNATSVYGQDGNDTINVQGDVDMIDGGTGNDTIELGGSGTVYGRAGNDTLTAGRGDGEVRIDAGADNDTMIYDVTSVSGDVGDRVDGGSGTDTLVLRFDADSPWGSQSAVEMQLSLWDMFGINSGTLTAINLDVSSVETVNLVRANGTVRTFNL